MKKIRVGSRDSALAVRQAELVMEAIAAHAPEIQLELVTMKTTGDLLLDRPLDKIGGKGLFVKELDRALLEGGIDIAVHSCKDLPGELDPRLPLVAVGRREDSRDVLILPAGAQELEPGRPVGCSSKRRAAQLEQLYPGVGVEPVRGNVGTRLQKLDRGEFGALVLAAAGLRRLGLWERASRVFTPEEMLPAAGQGVLAVQGRAGEDFSYLDGFCDEASRVAVTAERAFVAALGASCSSLVAAYARLEGGRLLLRGMVQGTDGALRRDEITGAPADAGALGTGLAARMKPLQLQ